MILKSITPQHFGPFGHEATLQLDPEVTVLTGPNDVGKSLTLRAIELLLTNKKISVHEVNRNRFSETKGIWTEDSEIICTGVFESTDIAIKGGKLPKEIRPHNKVTVRKQMTVHDAKIILVESSNGRSNPSVNFASTVSVLKLPLESEVKQEINLGQMNEAEEQLLRLAFGNGFSLQQHKSDLDIDRSFRIREAEEKLNDRLRSILPTTMPLQFKLTEVQGNADVLGIGIVDRHRGFTPLGSRGAGVRRIMNVMGALLRHTPDNGHSIVLYDEPETSLHSDAQHILRRLLESIASHPNVQVVYSTHSPAMVNTLRPQSIRVIERRRENDKAVSVFLNEAYAGNYALVRSSLGISPADSLLYSPITIIAEGISEVRCLPIVLGKLAKARLIDQALLDILLPETHIVDGEGSSFEYMCRLAKSQNARPILFLDGDKGGDLPKVQAKHPEVPVISLADGIEFEQIVPTKRYIEAAAKLLEDTSGNLSEAGFREWEQNAKLKPNLMFSKRIERWLEDEFDKWLSKPRLMETAIALSEPSEIQAEPFQRLVQQMKLIGDLL